MRLPIRLGHILVIAASVSWCCNIREVEEVNNLNKGIELYKRGMYDSALIHLTEHISQDSVNSKALYYRGLALAHLELYKASSNNLMRAILNGFEPQDSAYFVISSNLIDLGQYESSISVVSRAIELNPKNYGYYLTRAEGFYQIGHLNMCCEDLDEAISLGDTMNISLFDSLCSSLSLMD